MEIIDKQVLKQDLNLYQSKLREVKRECARSMERYKETPSKDYKAVLANYILHLHGEIEKWERKIDGIKKLQGSSMDTIVMIKGGEEFER